MAGWLQLLPPPSLSLLHCFLLHLLCFLGRCSLLAAAAALVSAVTKWPRRGGAQSDPSPRPRNTRPRRSCSPSPSPCSDQTPGHCSNCGHKLSNLLFIAATSFVDSPLAKMPASWPLTEDRGRHDPAGGGGAGGAGGPRHAGQQLPARHARGVQPRAAHRVGRGQVPQAVPAVETPGPVEQDHRWVTC